MDNMQSECVGRSHSLYKCVSLLSKTQNVCLCWCWMVKWESGRLGAVTQVLGNVRLQNLSRAEESFHFSCGRVRKNVSQLSSYFSNYYLRFKRHNFISLTTLMLSSSANMFHTSIVTTPYHSQILIWIRLCHVRLLRKWGFFPLLYSPLTHFLFPLSLSHLHAASSQALWCACFNLELNGICGTAAPISGSITDPRVHCGICLHSGEWVSR